MSHLKVNFDDRSYEAHLYYAVDQLTIIIVGAGEPTAETICFEEAPELRTIYINGEWQADMVLALVEDLEAQPDDQADYIFPPGAGATEPVEVVA